MVAGANRAPSVAAMRLAPGVLGVVAGGLPRGEHAGRG